MYGVVNKAIQGLVTENFGEEKWLEVKTKAGIDEESFLSNESYPDAYTYKLAAAASEQLNMSLSDVLIAFGEYWIAKTGMQHYGELMKAGGQDLKEFLINLPGFHSRIMLIYPKLQPPEFKITDVQSLSLHLHYYSDRPGLKYFVYGLINGLAKMFNTPVTIEIISDRDLGHHHEIYKVNWN